MAFGLIHEMLMRGRDEHDQLRINALLGMPGAQEAYDRERADTVVEFGIEVG
jgi:hypothetical protein